MKKFLSSVLAIALVLSILPTGLLGITASAASDCEHNWNLYDTSYPVGGSCEDYRTDYYECLECGETKSENTLIGHSYNSYEDWFYGIYYPDNDYDENICMYRFRKCDRYDYNYGDICGYADLDVNTAKIIPHYFVDGVCVECGYEPLICEHVYDEGTVTVPTCIDAGYTTYTCTVCGDSYTADETAALGHSYGDGVVTEPTATEQGYTTYTCTVCGDSYQGDYTSALSTTTTGTSGYYTYSLTGG